MEHNKRWHILVIDNNHDSINYLQNVLDPKQYNIVTINDGKKGFDLLLNQPEHFSAIIIGQEILNTNSIRLLHKINSCSMLKAIPVIMEASFGTMEEMDLCIRAGARYYIPKPIDKAIIPSVIATAVRDHDRYRLVEQSVIHSKPLNTLIMATFKVKQLDEAQNLAAFLANECPNPKLAAIGINEILINAIEHGNLGITYQEKTKLHQSTAWLAEIERRLFLPENHDKVVTATFNKSNTHINIRITDEGNGFDWRQYQNLDSNRAFDNHGRGIIMARTLAFEDLIYHGKGNDVECIIPLAL